MAFQWNVSISVSMQGNATALCTKHWLNSDLTFRWKPYVWIAELINALSTVSLRAVHLQSYRNNFYGLRRHNMPVLINFKICDNSKDCNGIAICPTGAFHWDEPNHRIAIEDSICTLCGACEEDCEVGAIRIARTEEEYRAIKEEIDRDPRRTVDLFVDRYGAMPIQEYFTIPQEKFDLTILQASKLAVVELYDVISIRCLVTSIPIKELFAGLDLIYRKMEVRDDSILSVFGIEEELPALLFFVGGNLIGKIEGYYKVDNRQELVQRVHQIITNAGVRLD